MRIERWIAAVALLLAAGVRPGLAADNTLTAEEKAAGWELLWDGTQQDLEGRWVLNKRLKDDFQPINVEGKPKRVTVEDGAFTPFGSTGYLVIFRDPADVEKKMEDKDKSQFGDFVLKCDVKMVPRKGGNGCNSGIFIRTGDPQQCVQTGLEFQITNSNRPGKHSYAAIYDAAGPTKNATKGLNQWDHVVITCKGPMVTASVNGEDVLKMNCAEYTTAKQNPDGTPNKFNTPIAKFPRSGYIGFQDHNDGSRAYFKNIKILKLDK